jgi:hypothetical protein
MALPNRFTIEPQWTGCRGVIIGGGPSFTLAQNRLIARARLVPSSRVRVIAVNDAIYGAWWADWHHACDTTWWREHIQSVHSFPGIKTTLAEDVPEPWVTGYLENSGDVGFDPDPSRCRTGANGVYQAICIFMHSGVKDIILVGVDMKTDDNGKNHWFGNHPQHFGSDRVDYAKQMIPKFETLLPAMEERGVKVRNASPGSALTIFPHVDLDSALR